MGEHTSEDELLVTRSQRGDASAFGVLYDTYLPRIYRFIYYKTFSHEVAEDLTSDVFHKALLHINRFDPGKGSFSQWIYRIARNTVIDHYRTHKSTVPIDDAFDIGFDARTEESLDARTALLKVSAYMKTLPSTQRELLTLRLWEELSYREIAEILGGTEDSVKMGFSRAVKKLRDACGPDAPTLVALFGSSLLPFTTLS
jgi:RNA polymerase sigma-70 factor, ECF subfamily